jgi:hypothetical protein
MSASQNATKKRKVGDGNDDKTKGEIETNYKGVFDGKLGFGQKCAVLVVDLCNAYTTKESINYCGGEGFGVVDAVNESVELLAAARAKNVPIVYTRYVRVHTAGLFWIMRYIVTGLFTTRTV